MTNEGVHVEEANSCFLCSSRGTPLYTGLRDRLFGAPGVWDLMHCSECDLVWLNPRPIPEAIGRLYEKYYTHNSSGHAPKLALLRQRIREGILASTFGYDELAKGLINKAIGKILSQIGPIREMVELGVMTLKGTTKGKLLDVGCGNGQFLARMRDLGWEVVGVEPDGEAVKIARERFGLLVYEGTLENVRFPDNSFDAITMNHVIEHVWDPVGTLKECRRILKPGGKLVVVTPNIRSLGRRIFGERWRGWEVPRHLFLLSPKSLRACAERAGLRVKRLCSAAKGARYLWEASRLLQQMGSLPGGSPQRRNPRLVVEGLAFWFVEYALSRAWMIGEELVLVASV